MIALLDGIVADVAQDHFIILIGASVTASAQNITSSEGMLSSGGVGYEIVASSQTLADVQMLLGQRLRVWIHTHVREDAFQLFGFLTRAEKEFFLQLLKVNGVGPKMALAIMSGAKVAQIQDWIEASDAKALSALPKVGKKTAEQIILTLQGKLVRIEKAITKGKVVSTMPEVHRQISSALINLGFKNQNVDQFVQTLGISVTIEEGVREGLKQLSRQI